MMQLDDKTMMELAEQLGLRADRKPTMEKIRDYESKSDAELVSEIMKIRDQLAAADVPYEKQIAAVQSLMPMMNQEQKARLSKIVGLLKK